MAEEFEQIRKWRQKAEECRAVGEQMALPSARDSFRRMAAAYDQLADNLEGRGRRSPGPRPPKAG